MLMTTAIGGDLTIKTGDGFDTIDTAGATVGGTKKIEHGEGADEVS